MFYVSMKSGRLKPHYLLNTKTKIRWDRVIVEFNKRGKDDDEFIKTLTVTTPDTYDHNSNDDDDCDEYMTTTTMTSTTTMTKSEIRMTIWTMMTMILLVT